MQAPPLQLTPNPNPNPNPDPDPNPNPNQACADFGLPYHFYNSWGHAVVAHYEYLKEMGRRWRC